MFLATHPWSDGGLVGRKKVHSSQPQGEQERLVGRHVSTRMAKDMEEADWRADENDMPSQ